MRGQIGRAALLCASLALAGLAGLAVAPVSAHVEDICINPPGIKPTSGVYNFYTIASRLGCDYGNINASCVAGVVAQSASTFSDTSNCRGHVHFNAVYFTAAALGFTQDVSYFMAAFAQAIDFVQYKGVDSCGRDMPNRFWTPPLRGFLRTATAYGGTNRHLGVPFVGFASAPPPLLKALDGVSFPLYQSAKTYNGGSKKGCDANFFKDSFDDYVGQCPALRPNLEDKFYEGSLAQGKKWAMGETNLLCNGGFTTINPKTMSPFAGSQCPTGDEYSVDTNELQQGPIPLTGGGLQLGEQVIHFECSPNCTAPTYNVTKKIYVSELPAYLKAQAKQYGYAKFADGSVVPELIVRMGIFLHWVTDRASHWYCTDAPGSGVVAVPKTHFKYDLYMYLDPNACNYLSHGQVHYWEQAVNQLAPGSYTSLQYVYRILAEFRSKYLASKPSWFRKNAKILSEEQVVGTYEKPGIMFNVTMIKEARARFQAEVRALRLYSLPPMPGFERMC